jgi:membrane-associated phospholipid phosphatase
MPASKDPNRTIDQRRLFLFLGAMLALALFSFLFWDQQISQSVSTARHPAFYPAVRFLTDFGEGKYYFALVIFMVLFSSILNFYFKNIKNKKNIFFDSLSSWSLYALSCMLASGTVLQILKHVIGRQRPHVVPEMDPHVFDFFTSKWHYHSMPSGHSQTLFTFAMVLWITFPKLGKWFFALPLILALTRIPLEEHFTSDVIMGAFVGISMTLLVSLRWKKIKVIR